MEHETLLSSLNLFTLVAIVVVIGVAFAFHLRSRRNREATSRVLGIADKPPPRRRLSAARAAS